MSRSSIQPPTSPTIEDPPNDELAAGAEQGSYHEAIRESTEAARAGSGGGSGSYGASRSSRTVMNYPIDADLFYSTPTPTQPNYEQDEDGPGDVEYQEPAAEELLHPPDFKPFFTLVQDPETGEYHHPTVHYIFSDDDPEILTSAVLDTLDRNESTAEATRPLEDVEERYVILDIGADGKSVASAASLSADWQNLRADIGQAPSWGEANGDAERGLMLKIAGKHKERMSGTRNGKSRQDTVDGIEELVKKYGEGLDRLNEMLSRS